MEVKDIVSYVDKLDKSDGIHCLSLFGDGSWCIGTRMFGEDEASFSGKDLGSLEIYLGLNNGQA